MVKDSFTSGRFKLLLIRHSLDYKDAASLRSVLKPVCRFKKLDFNEYIIESKKYSINHIDTEALVSDFVIVLINNKLFSSGYLNSPEFRILIDKSINKELVLIPVFFEECNWNIDAFEQLKVLPENKIPYSQWKGKIDHLIDLQVKFEKILDDNFHLFFKVSNNTINTLNISEGTLICFLPRGFIVGENVERTDKESIVIYYGYDGQKIGVSAFNQEDKIAWADDLSKQLVLKKLGIPIGDWVFGLKSLQLIYRIKDRSSITQIKEVLPNFDVIAEYYQDEFELMWPTIPKTYISEYNSSIFRDIIEKIRITERRNSGLLIDINQIEYIKRNIRIALADKIKDTDPLRDYIITQLDKLEKSTDFYSIQRTLNVLKETFEDLISHLYSRTA